MDIGDFRSDHASQLGSLGSRGRPPWEIFLRCAALTAPWSWAISFSLNGGGVGPPESRRDFVGFPSSTFLGMAISKDSRAQKHASERGTDQGRDVRA
jgi:hypothetical protein